MSKNLCLRLLENNPSLRIQRANPLISRTNEETARSVFDPVLSGGINANRTGSPVGGSIGSTTNPPGAGYNNTVNGTVGINELLPTGTTVNLQGTSSYNSSDAFSDSSTRLRVTVSQASFCRGRS